MNTTYKFLLPIAFSATVLFSSCELYNPVEPVPAYIHIQKFTLTTNSATQGSNSQKITDAWVYVDDQIIGCFELPVTFPVLSEGTHRVKISPGIKVNGIAANRGQYPFYTSYEQDVDFQKGTTTILSPTVAYKSSAQFVFLQNFETLGTTLSITSQSDTIIEYMTDPAHVFEGTKCLAGYVDATRFRFECATTNAFDLKTGGAPVFLEFNYKCNYELVVSVIAQGTFSINQFPVLYLNPSANWNKAYVYLTPTVSGAFTANDYKIVWGIRNLAGVDSAAVLLDNIKLIQ